MDILYWQKYYMEKGAPLSPSKFAHSVMNTHVSSGQRLVELGSGNGRDATFFGANGVKVTAIDQASHEIEDLARSNDNPNIEYRTDDFTNLAPQTGQVDAVYSRFTLHSVSEIEQRRTLEWAADALSEGGRLCVEARGRLNSLFGQGEPVEGQENAFIHEGHYRRFLDIDALDVAVRGLGLTTVYSNERRGFAPFNGEDAFFIRHIAQKDA